MLAGGGLPVVATLTASQMLNDRPGANATAERDHHEGSKPDCRGSRWSGHCDGQRTAGVEVGVGTRTFSEFEFEGGAGNGK